MILIYKQFDQLQSLLTYQQIVGQYKEVTGDIKVIGEHIQFNSLKVYSNISRLNSSCKHICSNINDDCRYGCSSCSFNIYSVSDLSANSAIFCLNQVSRKNMTKLEHESWLHNIQ